MPSRKKQQDYLNIGIDKGFVWVGMKIPTNSREKTFWKCTVCNTISNKSYSALVSNRGCKKCATIASRHTRQDYHDKASKNGFLWVGSHLPSGCQTKTMWQCRKLHTWLASYNGVRDGSDCPHCDGIAKKTETDYNGIAIANNIIFAANEIPKNTRTKTLWMCSSGHLFMSSYGVVSRGHLGCECSLTFSKTKDDYQDLANKKGFTWIGHELPENTKTKTAWQCSKNHVFAAPYHGLQQGNGCPTCQNYINGVPASKPQIEIAKMLGAEVNYKVGKHYIDCALPSKMIAIEYDSWYWHKNQLAEDKKREKELLDTGWRVLSIKTNRLVPTKEKILALISELEHIPYIELIMDDWGK